MVEVAVTEGTSVEVPAAIVEGEVAHAEASVAREEAASEAAVQIAETQAAASVAIAEVHAETDQAAIAAAADVAQAVTREELALCQASTENLRAEVSEMRSILETLALKVSPPNQRENQESHAQTPDNHAVPVEPVKKKSPFKLI